MNRRHFIKNSSLAGLGLAFYSNTSYGATDFPVVRVSADKRNFSSPAVEETITRLKSKIKDPELAWLFENCFPNTLDTTVHYKVENGKPDTFVITGDIDAMWLRDSTAQVWPYLPLAKKNEDIRKLLEGVVRRQAKCLLIDPYANAFYAEKGNSEWMKDLTDMKPELHERKWELDSVCYTIRLAYHYWKTTGDTSVFDADWSKAMKGVLRICKEQQRKNSRGSYKFGRNTFWSTDTVPGNGYGNPTKPIGMIHSIFRPSDDATIFPFYTPANLFAVVSFKQLGEIAETVLKDATFAQECKALSAEVKKAIQEYAIYNHPKFGKIYALEVDGFGNHLLQDDANVPNLLGLPYLGAVDINDPIYQNTRKFVLSSFNPYFFKGKAAEGIGSPHTLVDNIWHIGLVMRAMTSTNDQEIAAQLKMIKNTHAGTGFMHESFDKDDSSKFTRKWFAWANTLFGELILKIEKERPHLL